MILLESTRIERVAILTQKLITGGEVTTTEFADACGVTQRTIQRDLADISRVLPVYFDGRAWVYVPSDEPLSISPV